MGGIEAEVGGCSVVEDAWPARVAAQAAEAAAAAVVLVLVLVGVPS